MQNMKMILSLVLVLFLFDNCSQTSNNPEKCYEYMLNPLKWDEVKGIAQIVNEHLELVSTGSQYGCEVQSKTAMTHSCEFEIKVKSDRWAIDTSIGLEIWTDHHYAIVITNGNLGIINQSILGAVSEQEHYEPIIGWEAIKNSENVFELKWFPSRVELYVNGAFNCQYTGPKVPGVPLKIRLNSSNDLTDRVVIDYVVIRTSSSVETFRDDFNYKIEVPCSYPLIRSGTVHDFITFPFINFSSFKLISD